MTRIEKTVFISYRRANFPWAYCIYQDLTHHGFDVFLDYQGIDSGSFEKVILENIRARAHFVIILSPSALERCNQPGDWLRREIETAIDEKRNIIPIMLEGFDFGSPLVKQGLTGKLSSLKNYNAMGLIAEYLEAGFEKLRNRFLNVALDDVYLHTLAEDTKEITATIKTAVNETPPIKKEQLTAQEWMERGNVYLWAENLDEAIRCYTEAISLTPEDVDVYFAAAVACELKGDLNSAIRYYEKIQIINPGFLDIHYHIGHIYYTMGDINLAEENYRVAIEKDPSSVATIPLIGILQKTNRTPEAKELEKLLGGSTRFEDEYNRACFESIQGNTDKALELLKIWLSANNGKIEKRLARQDIDFENIRDDPRFKELVGE